MGTYYDIVFEGKIIPGKDPGEVRKALASVLKKDATTVETLFSGRPFTLRKQVAGETAEKFKSKFESADLVVGSAVISIDFFKQFVATLRKIFGGTVRSYETLLDRARREAILRMKEMAGDAVVIVNVRIEAAPIGKKARKGNVSCVEAVAYGTALWLRPP